MKEDQQNLDLSELLHGCKVQLNQVWIAIRHCSHKQFQGSSTSRFKGHREVASVKRLHEATFTPIQVLWELAQSLGVFLLPSPGSTMLLEASQDHHTLIPLPILKINRKSDISHFNILKHSQTLKLNLKTMLIFHKMNVFDFL